MEIRAIQQKAKSQVLNSESDFVCCFCLPRMFEEIRLRPWTLTRSLSRFLKLYMFTWYRWVFVKEALRWEASFFGIFLPVAVHADHGEKFPCATLFVWRKDRATTFFFHPPNFSVVPKNSTLWKFTCIFHFKRVRKKRREVWKNKRSDWFK